MIVLFTVVLFQTVLALGDCAESRQFPIFQFGQDLVSSQLIDLLFLLKIYLVLHLFGFC